MLALVNTTLVSVLIGWGATQACTAAKLASSLLFNVVERLLLLGTYDQMARIGNSWGTSSPSGYSHPEPEMKKNR